MKNKLEKEQLLVIRNILKKKIYVIFEAFYEGEDGKITWEKDIIEDYVKMCVQSIIKEIKEKI